MKKAEKPTDLNCFVVFMTPDIGFIKVSLLFCSRILILLRFRCFFAPGYWFYSGFVAFLISNLDFTKVSLFFCSRILVLLRFRCFFAHGYLFCYGFVAFFAPRPSSPSYSSEDTDKENPRDRMEGKEKGNIRTKTKG